MGKRGGKNKGGKGKKPNVWDDKKSKKVKLDGQLVNNRNFDPWVLRSEAFDKYYKSMGICKDDVEYEAMIKTMQQPLPSTFRINTTIGPIKNLVFNQLNEIINDIKSVEKIEEKDDVVLPTNTGTDSNLRDNNNMSADFSIEDIKKMAPISVPWFPNQIAWKSNVPRKLLRKVPALNKFNRFLVNHNEQGYITRQEEVSMIPPLFLNVDSNHFVLDMCAAPGSKTTQIIEELHLKEINSTNSSKNGKSLPTGCVIANDVDLDRSYLLVHNTQRLGTIAVAITNHEAQNYPIPFVLNENGERAPLFFDRILCDVPCSGDGTSRKNPEIWREWRESNGANLNLLQLKIATRACHLLKVGGRMVYSTCSLNPKENETVVADLLIRSNGSMKLVDVSKELPQLIRAPGLKQYPDVPYTLEQYTELGMEHCLRIHPHFQDTGGFFVAVLEKVADMPNQLAKRKTQQEQDEDKEYIKNKLNETDKTDKTIESIETTETTTTTTNNNNEKPKSLYHNERALKENDKRLGGKEDPFCKLSGDILNEIEIIKTFYGLSEDFPIEQLLGRSETPKKLYFASKALCEIILNDVEARKFKIINCGIKVFLKHDISAGSECKWRISQDSVGAIAPYVTKRNVTIAHSDLVMLLQREPQITEFSPEVSAQLQSLNQGCFIFKINNDPESPSNSMVFAAWKGKTSVHLLVSKQEIHSLKGIFGIVDDGKSPKKSQSPIQETSNNTNTTENVSMDQ